MAAVYLAAAKLGLTTAFTAEQVTLVWPPTGLSLGILMLLGPDLWPGLLLGAFVANLTAHQPVAVALAVAAGNTLEAMTGAWLLRRFIGTPLSQSWQRSLLAVVQHYNQVFNLRMTDSEMSDLVEYLKSL